MKIIEEKCEKGEIGANEIKKQRKVRGQPKP